MNRLADETSPYLRQHADNPVDWYPWGPEAFEKARAEDKPILLSVGYSACHWCHVMAHESFEDDATAAVVNDLFVAVKVDREERPDVDAIYMEAVQAMTGGGGWPMTVFMTPEGEPFYGGTYFPKERRGGMPSFVELCRSVEEAWSGRRGEILDQANRLTEALRRSEQLQVSADLPGDEVLDGAIHALIEAHDETWGGFGRAPKFPGAMSIDLLLRSHHHRGGAELLRAALTSLDAMAAGGIYDHLGGGFARYSVDDIWLVPHFEKMLYDNALLTRAYLHAWQLTDEPRIAQVLAETIGYVLRDLQHPDGGWFSAEDADSEGVEGKFYVWSVEEIREVLGTDAEAAIEWYGAKPEGNFEGANILNRIEQRGELARPDAVEQARAKLFEHRLGRIRPGLDDKILTEWNALMLAALAEAAAATGNDDWRAAAVANGDFLVGKLRRDDGRWLRSWQADGGARHLAYAHDYAALVDAFTRLGELTGAARWTAEAVATADGLLDLFWDDDRGGVFTTGHDAEALVTRPKDLMDNATPSANSLAALALIRLAALTGVDRYRDRAEDILRLLGGVAGEHPNAFGHLLAAVDLVHTGITEVVVPGDHPDLVDVVQRSYRPNVVLAWGEPYASPLWEGREAGSAHVCEQFACRLPADTPEALEAQLSGR
jgi:uncharacterized protein YyaL (SSP411 family)